MRRKRASELKQVRGFVINGSGSVRYSFVWLET
jgi:hypothetical protein